MSKAQVTDLKKMYTAKNILLPLAAVALFIILVGILTSNLQQTARHFRIRKLTPDKPKVLVRDIPVYVDIAKTPREWSLGLSGRESMNMNEGMLFIFDKKERPRFWMKDMLFPIDIIWIVDGAIIQIEQNVKHPEKDTPLNELEIYQPFVPVEYVLEVNAGFVKKYQIAVRDPVDLTEVKK